MKNDINVKGSGEMRRWGKEKGWRSSGEMKRYGREKGWRSVNVKLKKILKIIIRKWKEKRYWRGRWRGEDGKKKVKIGERGVCFV